MSQSGRTETATSFQTTRNGAQIPVGDDSDSPATPAYLRRSPLPGFGVGLGVTMAYISVLLLIPLAALSLKTAEISFEDFWKIAFSQRAQAAYRVTFVSSAIAAVISSACGLLLAWVLTRYEFPGRRFVDALIDLPFALPTAVAGLTFSALLIKKGWYGQFLVPMGIHGAYSGLGIVIVLTFVGLPFVVRTVQPVLESMDRDVEEAAASMGASRWQTFQRVLFPAILPSLLTGFALSFARGLGEYGSVIFISGNKPFETEIAPYLIVFQIEDFRYAEASAIAFVLVVASLLCLAVINWLERRSQRYAD